MSSPAENSVADYIRALLTAESFKPQIAHHRVIGAEDAVYAEPTRPWPRAISDILVRQGIASLYAHQAQAVDLARAGRHVVIATPTASGKSLVYNLPVLESFLTNPDSRALYLFPLKALAQDQLGAFNRLTEHWPADARPEVAVYDGDTSDHFRRKIRLNPPNVLISNPEMLHLALCPHHELWATFWAGLDYVVVDEVHTYRGLLGSHMAQVFRRLNRICANYGAKPAYIFCSATVGNPAELTRRLTGFDSEVITKGSAPKGQRHMVFINPEGSPATAAIQLLQAALSRNLRTIVYCQSRRMTELISLWAGSKAGKYASRISAYRAGFLPEERREIEARLENGELLAVVTTSALELGIDIGNLDLCILVGYPGSIMSFQQRGGRVGRHGNESAVLFVAQEDALDQHFIKHPHDFFSRPPEDAVLNPANPVIVRRHLCCAAAELPLKAAETWPCEPEIKKEVDFLQSRGELLRSADGHTYYSARKRPQRDVDLRSSGGAYTIETPEKQVIGTVDGIRALREAHPGAVYLHRGRTYTIQDLDLGGRIARAAPDNPNYYTRVRSHKFTEILSIEDSRPVLGTMLYTGVLKVTETITGYEKRSTSQNRLLSVVPLEFPPLEFETQGVWFTIPESLQREAESRFIHFMGSIHALEHAAIGIFPLLVLADRNDLGGISTPMHAQTGAPTVFIYDGIPGGAGLTHQAFRKGEELLRRTHAAVADCACELGCPSCVHSPKCGSGNRPIDKAGALFLAEGLLSGTVNSAGRSEEPQGDDQLEIPRSFQASSSPEPRLAGLGKEPFQMENTLAVQNKMQGENLMSEEKIMTTATLDPYLVLDVETQLSAQEVGGWHRADRMRVSVAVLYDSRDDSFTAYTEDRMPEMLAKLASGPLVVGFNLKRFDYEVLSLYSGGKAFFHSFPTLDMLQVVYDRLSYRLSLDNLAQATLGAPKSADGLMALKWWKEGKIEEITRYCRDDVRITRDLYLFGLANAFLLFTNKAGQAVRVPVDFKA